MEPRLKTKLVIQAALIVASRRAIPMVVVRRGDADAGTILVKVNRLGSGFNVLAQTRTLHGELAWFHAVGDVPVDEATADTYIARQVKRDPDLWVIEIEDRDGQLVFEGPIL